MTEAVREREWTRTLTALPVGRAVVRLAGDSPAVVRICDVPDPRPAPGFEVFLSAAVARSGQSLREVEDARRWRRSEAERVAGGGPTPAAPEDDGRPAVGRRQHGMLAAEADDGSLA